MNTQAGEIENISGKINAIFPHTVEPSGIPFARAPYESQRINSPNIPGNNYLVIGSTSGAHNSSPAITSDFRALDFSLRKGITSGTYKFPGGANGDLTDVQYSEMSYIGNSYVLLGLTETEATLELEVLGNGRYYKSNSFTITGKTNKGETLSLKVTFELYVTID